MKQSENQSKNKKIKKDKIYKCKVESCQKSYATYPSLYQHIKNCHPDQKHSYNTPQYDKSPSQQDKSPSQQDKSPSQYDKSPSQYDKSPSQEDIQAPSQQRDRQNEVPMTDQVILNPDLHHLQILSSKNLTKFKSLLRDKVAKYLQQKHNLSKNAVIYKNELEDFQDLNEFLKNRNQEQNTQNTSSTTDRNSASEESKQTERKFIINEKKINYIIEIYNKKNPEIANVLRNNLSSSILIYQDPEQEILKETFPNNNISQQINMEFSFQAQIQIFSSIKSENIQQSVELRISRITEFYYNVLRDLVKPYSNYFTYEMCLIFNTLIEMDIKQINNETQEKKIGQENDLIKRLNEEIKGNDFLILRELNPDIQQNFIRQLVEGVKSLVSYPHI